MYEEKPKGFIEELQSLNDKTKKRVLVISTIVIMAIVITVWFSYFNSIVVDANSGVPSSTAANGASMWQNIVSGFASIGNVFNSSSQYTVQGDNSTTAPAITPTSTPSSTVSASSTN